MANFVEPRKDKPSKTPRINKIGLKKELRDLIECLGFGHGRYQEFPEYNIRNSSDLKSRINTLIDLISR